MSERFKMCKWQMCIEENNYFIYPTSDSWSNSLNLNNMVYMNKHRFI
jgi:hypothetical protein